MYSKLLWISLECKEAKWWNVISFLTLEGNFVKHNRRSMSSGLADSGYDTFPFWIGTLMLLFPSVFSVTLGVPFCPFFIQGYFGKDPCTFFLWASSSAKIDVQSFLLQCIFIESFGRIICLLMFGTANTNFPFEGEAFLTAFSIWIAGGKKGSLLLITDFSSSWELSISGCCATDRHWFQ